MKRDGAGARQEHPSYYLRVWEQVREVPRGKVVTYGQVALLLGAPMAARATGYALHSLPSETTVPWWRVVNAGGGISLRNRGSNADLQRAMLENEGVQFDREGKLDLGMYRWWPGGRPE